jgi:hypothetical protein
MLSRRRWIPWRRQRLSLFRQSLPLRQPCSSHHRPSRRRFPSPRHRRPRLPLIPRLHCERPCRPLMIHLLPLLHPDSRIRRHRPWTTRQRPSRSCPCRHGPGRTQGRRESLGRESKNASLFAQTHLTQTWTSVRYRTLHCDGILSRADTPRTRLRRDQQAAARSAAATCLQWSSYSQPSRGPLPRPRLSRRSWYHRPKKSCPPSSRLCPIRRWMRWWLRLWLAHLRSNRMPPRRPRWRPRLDPMPIRPCLPLRQSKAWFRRCRLARQSRQRLHRQDPSRQSRPNWFPPFLIHRRG